LVCVLLGLTTGWGDGDGAFFVWCLRDGSISRAWTTGELLVLRQTDGSGLVALSAADGTERWRSDAQGAVGARSDQVLVMYDDGSRTTGDEDCDGGCPLTGIDLVTGQTR